MKMCLTKALLAFCIVLAACSEDEGPKFPVVEDTCESNEDCTVPGEFCQTTCNLVGGWEDHPQVGCNYSEGAVSPKYVNQCIPIQGCNNTTDPDRTSIVFEGRNFKATGSFCPAANEADWYNGTFERSAVFYAKIIADGRMNSFDVDSQTSDSFGTDGYDGPGIPVFAGGLTSDDFRVSLSKTDAEDLDFITPVNYSIDVWQFETCVLDEDCLSFCDHGVCADCSTDADCSGETPFCVEPFPNRTPQTCLATKDVE